MILRRETEGRRRRRYLDRRIAKQHMLEKVAAARKLLVQGVEEMAERMARQMEECRMCRGCGACAGWHAAAEALKEWSKPGALRGGAPKPVQKK